MKFFSILIIFVSQVVLAQANTRTSDILRSRINSAHFNPVHFRMGIITITPKTLMLNLVMEPTPSKFEEKVVALDITDVKVLECGLITYEAVANDKALILEDRSQANCGISYNFSVALKYETIENETVFTSRFDGTDLEVIDFQNLVISVGQEGLFNNNPVILPVIPKM